MLNHLPGMVLHWVVVLAEQVARFILDLCQAPHWTARDRLNKRVPLIIATILTVPLWSAQAHAGYPRWITSPPHERYAIVVVGMATAQTLEQGQRAAIMNAANQAAEYIGVTVSGGGISLRTMDEQRLEDEVRSSIERTPLKGGLVKEWYFETLAESFQVFVLVHYPLAEIENIKTRLTSEETERVTRYKMRIMRGESAWKEGAALKALRNFSGPLIDGRGSDNQALMMEARANILSLLQSFDMSIVSGDGQVIEPGKKQHSALIVSVSSRLEGARLPVEGVPVRFDWGGIRTKKTMSVLTDSAGEARLVFDGVGLSTGMQRITASLGMEDLLAGVGIKPGKVEDHALVAISEFKPPGVTLTLKVVPHPRPTRILLLIEESNMGRPSKESIVMQALSEALQQAGFRVIVEHEIGRTNIERLQTAFRKDRVWPLRPEIAHEADIALIGTAATEKGSENMGLVISSHATLFVRAVDLESGSVVAQKNILRLAGFGDTPELAGEKALIEAGVLAAESMVNQLSVLEEGDPNETH